MESKTGIKTFDKLSEIPVVSTALTNVTDYYGQIKERNVLLRTSCNLAELSFKTIKFAATPITTFCHRPISSVDAYLSGKVDMIENTYPVITQPTDKLTAVAYSQAKDIYEKTNETIHIIKNKTVQVAAGCASSVVETCLENKYAKIFTDPVLDFTEKSLNYILPTPSVYDGTAQCTVKRIYNINKRVYRSVYETTFSQLSKLHVQFEITIKKMMSLKRFLDLVYLDTKEKMITSLSQNTLVMQCAVYLNKNNLSIQRIENISKDYIKVILADVNNIVVKYMNLVKNFPIVFNGTKLKQTIENITNQMNRETFSIYLATTIEYLQSINQALLSYTNQMLQVVSDSKSSLVNMCLQTLKRPFSRDHQRALMEEIATTKTNLKNSEYPIYSTKQQNTPEKELINDNNINNTSLEIQSNSSSQELSSLNEHSPTNLSNKYDDEINETKENSSFNIQNQDQDNYSSHTPPNLSNQSEDYDENFDDELAASSN